MTELERALLLRLAQFAVETAERGTREVISDLAHQIHAAQPTPTPTPTPTPGS